MPETAALAGYTSALLVQTRPSVASPQARPSLEAVGIDVEKACEAAGLPAGFVPGQVTLTGLCSFIDLHTPARLRV